MNLFVNFFDRVKQAYYTGYFTSANEPDGIKNATHNSLVKLKSKTTNVAFSSIITIGHAVWCKIW
jgi:hypothetical protein